ncbi:MAG: bifunctional phosphoserine phosphatase/homoserine phosphotransferase ThrH [Armatimonadetes bacterium]|nr:bifunctional phosphoserine phosphatase/homoserine phosphotransferase ThrH [Armatimonadota bacterium]
MPEPSCNGPALLCLDLESILVPEIWQAVAARCAIPELGLTTRDLPDYHELMARRLNLLRQHGLGLPQLLPIVEALEPLPGAADFLAWARARAPVVILSDTFYELSAPLMPKLLHPLLLCHSLEVLPDGALSGYRLRVLDSKRLAVASFQQLGYRVLAVGDSHNDLTMLAQADRGWLFRPPAEIARSYGFEVLESFDELRHRIATHLVARP